MPNLSIIPGLRAAYAAIEMGTDRGTLEVLEGLLKAEGEGDAIKFYDREGFWPPAGFSLPTFEMVKVRLMDLFQALQDWTGEIEYYSRRGDQEGGLAALGRLAAIEAEAKVYDSYISWYAEGVRALKAENDRGPFGADDGSPLTLWEQAVLAFVG